MSHSNASPKYRLAVSAGLDYDHAKHQSVQVNGETLRLEDDRASFDLNVRIQDYTGYPDSSPKTSPYFEHPLHKNDQYSICFTFTPKQDINGNDLVFGNDFDKPLRHRLPPGFNAALRVVKWTIDSSLDGDAYADKPYLYSPALASWNQFRIGEKGQAQSSLMEKDLVVEEGADGQGLEERSKLDIPSTAAERQKFFQKEKNRESFVFEIGRTYMADFGNQYLSFSETAIRLPGIHIPVSGMVDEDNHELRYVLKDNKTGEVYLVVSYNLIKQDSENAAQEESK
ncbi:hypothetical protein N7539_001553 [Penicillium diatomitis]|uniref:Domain of unknown function at the cortex 1 domain-containing protein n=1 Tax=Penicillium diatomitis TaxID=2819901 RepID=A0A9W9XGW4_9EURO|nr:uncharacterized protein N7539_001553 [Penicillium diatomitis]KAJ5492807.1 hypothetical protein N7539_001553 [Penicillium diatomitis]